MSPELVDYIHIPDWETEVPSDSEREYRSSGFKTFLRLKVGFLTWLVAKEAAKEKAERREARATLLKRKAELEAYRFELRSAQAQVEIELEALQDALGMVSKRARSAVESRRGSTQDESEDAEQSSESVEAEEAQGSQEEAEALAEEAEEAEESQGAEEEAGEFKRAEEVEGAEKQPNMPEREVQLRRLQALIHRRNIYYHAQQVARGQLNEEGPEEHKVPEEVSASSHYKAKLLSWLQNTWVATSAPLTHEAQDDLHADLAFYLQLESRFHQYLTENRLSYH